MVKRGLDKKLEELEGKALGDLEPKERANLTLKALSEDNEKEAERLRESCPKYKYEMTDAEYTGKVREAMFYSILVYSWVLEALLMITCATQQMDEDEDVEVDPDKELSEQPFWRDFFVLRDYHIQANASIKFFEEYCKELDVEPYEVLGLISPLGGAILENEEFRERLGAPETMDSEHIEEEVEKAAEKLLETLG